MQAFSIFARGIVYKMFIYESAVYGILLYILDYEV